MHLTDQKIRTLEIKANDIRKDIIKMLLKAGSGHSAGPLGMADIFTAMYFYVLNHKPKKPFWEDRDRLVLSNAHICPVQYAAMAHAGYFPKKELLTLRQYGTRLQGHPHRTALPGIETTGGPLGEGISQACGIAYAGRMDKKKFNVYCVMGDGELNEGIVWEAFMFAGKQKLANMTVIVDRNNIQIDGCTEDIMPLEPLRDKFEAFGWHVLEIDGHNIAEFVGACEQAKAIVEQPVAIIAHTIPGKGVDFMEYDFTWHGKPPKEDEAEIAMHELRTLGGRIKSEHE
jgi:transketolase